MSHILGFQSQVLTDSILDVYRDSQAAVLKPIDVVDCRLYQRYVDEVGGYVLPRIYTDDISTDQPPKALALQTADRVCSKLDPVQDICDATHFLNERLEVTREDLKRLNDATCEYALLMASRGWKVIAGALGVGNPPNVADVALLADSIGMCWAWEYHSYDAPYMDRDPIDRVLRYRRLAAVLATQGVVKPLIIGELGVDGGVLGPDHAEQGYQSFPQYPYLPQLQWADWEMRQDSYVLCACVFGLAMDARWTRFDVAGQQDIFDWMGSQGRPRRVIEMQEQIDGLKAEVDTLFRQNALLTEALKCFRQGKFEGADGIDGLIVAMQGGQPLAFTPTYPPRAS